MSTITTYSKAALDKLIADWRQNLQGYKAQLVSGNVTISPATAGTFALDLTADTTLTIDGKLGQTVVLDVVTGGKKLTVVNGPTITADGVYALLLTRGKWAGGATGTASAGGSTGGTGSTGSTGGSSGTGGSGSTGGTTTGAVEIAHMDLTGVSDGTLVQDVALSNGAKFVKGAGQAIVKGGALTPQAGSGESTFKFNATTPKQRITVSYTLPAAGGDFTGAEVRFGCNTAIWLRITNDRGAPDLVAVADDGMEPTYTGALAPMSGTCVIVNDAPAGKITWTVNGVLIATATKKAPVSTDKALGASLLVNGDKLVTEGAVKISALKIEALT